MTADLSRMPVIDVDSHWTEPRDLWTSRAPSKLASRALRVRKDTAGVERWVIEEGQVMGSVRLWSGYSPARAIAASSTMAQMSNLVSIVNLISSGLLDRFPRLKFVSVESGIGWLPFMLESLDYQFVENGVGDLKLRPTEYFRRQICGSFWFECNPSAAIGWLGEDNLMFETDFPHATCLYPAVKETKERSLMDLPPRVQRKLLYENAARVYQLSLPD